MTDHQDFEAAEPRVDRHDRSGSMQLHVPSDWDEARILAFAQEKSHPGMSQGGYRVRAVDDPRLKGTPARASCPTHAGFDHVIVDLAAKPVPTMFTLTPEESEAIRRIILRRPGYTEDQARVAREIWRCELGLARGFDPETLGSPEENPYEATEFYADPLTDERRAELTRELEIVRTWRGLSKEFDRHAEYEATVEPLLKEAFAKLDAMGIPYLFDVVTSRAPGDEGEVIKGHTMVRVPPTRATKWQKRAGDLVVNKPTKPSLPFGLGDDEGDPIEGLATLLALSAGGRHFRS